MKELYVCAGLFAEGPTDYRFLLPLLDRLLDELLAKHYTARYQLAPSHGIDAPPGARKQPRELRIEAAIDNYWDRCNLFVVHADGANDPALQRARSITPGIAAARSRRLGCPIAACVPVRETEAWLLCDVSVFVARLGAAPRGLPRDPERVTDPKQFLEQVFLGGDSCFRPSTDYTFFGDLVDLSALRRLSAFQAFEQELIGALRDLAVAENLSR